MRALKDDYGDVPFIVMTFITAFVTHELPEACTTVGTRALAAKYNLELSLAS